MTVNYETGEIVEFDRAAAERRAERITLRLDAIADNYRAVLPMIREAIAKRDDLALGYRSPGDYVSDRFGQSLAGLGIEVRRAVVGELTEAGMSSRAIAPVVGVSERTAAYDKARVQGCTPAPQTPEPAEEGEADAGSGHTPQGGAAPSGAPTPEVPSDESGDNSPRPAVTTGIDGKQYRRPEPKAAPKRRPLPDAFFTAVYDLGRNVERVARLTEDDRFPQNAEKVAAVHRNDLLRVRDLLEQVISALPTEESNR